MIRRSFGIVAASLILVAGAAPALAQVGTAITYQGVLERNGTKVNTPADLRFTLFDAATAGNAVGSQVTRANESISNGLFNVPIDFGVNPYTSDAAHWLQIEVRFPAGSGNYVPMGARQKLTASPFSLATRGINVNPAGRVGIMTQPFDDSATLTLGTVPGGFPAASLRFRGDNNRLWDVAAFSSAGAAFGDFTISRSGLDFPFAIQGDTGNTLMNTAAGNVGIGTTTPIVKLDVAGDVKVRTGDKLWFGAPSEGTDSMYFQRSNASPNNSTLRLIIGDDPSASFDSFDICRDPTVTVYSFWSTGDAFKPGGGAWAALCDARAKHDIQPLGPTLDKVLQLHGKTFYYNDPKAKGAIDGLCTGFIAQEVETVFPEWVRETPEGLKSVSIRGFEALTVESLRDLRAEKDAQLAERDAKIADLTARLEKLEAFVEAGAAGIASK